MKKKNEKKGSYQGGDETLWLRGERERGIRVDHLVEGEELELAGLEVALGLKEGEERETVGAAAVAVQVLASLEKKGTRHEAPEGGDHEVSPSGSRRLALTAGEGTTDENRAAFGGPAQGAKPGKTLGLRAHHNGAVMANQLGLGATREPNSENLGSANKQTKETNKQTRVKYVEQGKEPKRVFALTS